VGGRPSAWCSATCTCRRGTSGRRSSRWCQGSLDAPAGRGRQSGVVAGASRRMERRSLPSTPRFELPEILRPDAPAPPGAGLRRPVRRAAKERLEPLGSGSFSVSTSPHCVLVRGVVRPRHALTPGDHVRDTSLEGVTAVIHSRGLPGTAGPPTGAGGPETYFPFCFHSVDVRRARWQHDLRE
jgi:hypothetical protein